MTSILREGGNKVKKDNQHHPLPDDLEQVLDEIRCNALSDADIDCLLDAVEPSVADPSVYDKSECAEELSVRRISADSSLGEGAEKCVPSKENLARKEDYEESANIADSMSHPQVIPDLERAFSFQYFIMVTL